jgi:transposase InsO family protein
MMTIDKDREFVGEDFQRTLKEHGIQQWRTGPYTPEQNGKMEGWWQTLERTTVHREEIAGLRRNTTGAGPITGYLSRLDA